MNMSGECVIPTSRQAVWEALNDPELLKQCIPGCDEVNKTSDTSFEAKVTAKVGPVRAKFSGTVEMSDIDPPNGYTISGEGSGGAAGFAKGGAKVTLTDDDGGTKLNYTVDATVGGKLAQIGSRLIDSTAKKMANDFFKKFAELLGDNETTALAGKIQPTDTGSSPAPTIASKTTPAQTKNQGGVSPTIWVTGTIIILLAMVFAFGGS